MSFSWKKSVIYQIYPKSFKDSNGDGIGDIQGIISQLDYFVELGVDYLWLTPIYISPQNDNGYDIADYYQIDPLYGTMADFDELLAKAHQKNLKIMMDIVVNHTSTEHHWFKEASCNPESPYRDYYIWRDGKEGKEPTNWISKFGGSAWAKVNSKDPQYYLHLFDKTQADLNWENPKLRDDIYQMMRWWLAKGIDGFRLDVVNLLSKSRQFLDDTLNTPMEDGRKYYTDGPRIHEFLHEMHQKVFSLFPHAITVGEMSSTTLENCVLYTQPNRQELNMVFNFHHLKVDYPKGEKWAIGEIDWKRFKELFIDWQTGMQKQGGWNALFLSNHDQPRAVSRFTPNQKYHYEGATLLAVLIHGLQGTPYIYQGEEFGMSNPEFSNIDQYRDIEALNYYQILQKRGYSPQESLKILAQKSRDNSRTPMQWNDSTNHGFTDKTPWIPYGKRAFEDNFLSDSQKEKSIFAFYKQLIALRKKEYLLEEGIFEVLPTNDSLFAYYRKSVDRSEYLLVINNLTDQEQSIDHSDINGLEIVLSNYQRKALTGILSPYEALILKGK